MNDRIRRIVNVGDGSWDNIGEIVVFYEGDSRAPERLSGDDALLAISNFCEQNGVDPTNGDAVADFYDEGISNGTCGSVNVSDTEAMGALDTDFAEATERAGNTTSVDPIPPVGTTGGDSGDGSTGGDSGDNPTDVDAGDDPIDDNPEEDDDYTAEVGEEVRTNRHIGRRVGVGVLAGASALAAGYGIAQMLNNDSEVTIDIDNEDEDEDDLDQNTDVDIDFDTATFEELMESMDEDDARRVVSETAMELVETFHEQTHKDDNFRLEEDEDTYLDLSFEEALVLTAFTNYSDDAETLAQIFGTYGITSTDAEDILESARTKLITYYMNAKEPSGLANIFFNEEDRAFFENFESEVIEFNTEHTTDTSDKVIRDVYYNYILDGATNYTNVSSFAKMLAFDAVYGGLNLVESSSTEHTQYLVFHGEGEEAETKYYIENILGLDYDSMSDEERQSYRENIIESGTELVNLLSTGETMTEDNSTQEERDAEKSITELVDQMGLCNSVNAEIEEALQNMTTYLSANSSNITTLNVSLSDTLRGLGLDDLASEVDASINTTLSQDLLDRISAENADAAEAVETYNTRVGAVNDTNRPSMEQIIRAANEYTATLENYAGDSKDVATLINNRRHTTEYNYTSDSTGLIGYDSDGVPIYDSSVLDGLTDEEVDEFIIENGVVIDETEETVTEEVDYEDLTEEEKEDVEEQKAVIEASLAIDNASAEGQIDANDYANSSSYSFSPSTVTNYANGEVYNLNSMTFADGVSYAYAFGDITISTSDSQIQAAAEAAAESYLNSFSSSEQEAIAEGMGTSWSNAKAQLKSAYISGYISQMETEIATAISMGEEMKATTDAILAEIAELNEEDELTNTDSTEVTEEETEEEVTTEVTTDDTTTSADEEDETEITEGEETVTDTTTDTTDDSTESTDANVDEEDDNLVEHYEEDEVLIEDANGNATVDYEEGEETVTSTVSETSSTVESTTEASVEETTTTTTSESTTSANVEEDTSVDDAIAAALEETISQVEEGDYGLPVETPKTR